MKHKDTQEIWLIYKEKFWRTQGHIIPLLRKTGNFTRCISCSDKRELIKALLRYLDTKHRKPKLRLR